MYRDNGYFNIAKILNHLPSAVAMVEGSERYRQIRGTVKFYGTPIGVLVYADIKGLPSTEDICGERVFGFHIHGGTSCSGNDSDPFADAITHYNPNGCPHPYHAGDLPPLFDANGRAISAFITNRFNIDEVIGKVVIIHASPDDFTTQPSGNSGAKIACGKIESIKR